MVDVLVYDIYLLQVEGFDIILKGVNKNSLRFASLIRFIAGSIADKIGLEPLRARIFFSSIDKRLGCVYHHFSGVELRFPNDFQGDFCRW